jgi:hypothetical protein
MQSKVKRTPEIREKISNFKKIGYLIEFIHEVDDEFGIHYKHVGDLGHWGDPWVQCREKNIPKELDEMFVRFLRKWADEIEASIKK